MLENNLHQPLLTQALSVEGRQQLTEQQKTAHVGELNKLLVIRDDAEFNNAHMAPAKEYLTDLATYLGVGHKELKDRNAIVQLAKSLQSHHRLNPPNPFMKFINWIWNGDTDARRYRIRGDLDRILHDHDHEKNTAEIRKAVQDRITELSPTTGGSYVPPTTTT